MVKETKSRKCTCKYSYQRFRIPDLILSDQFGSLAPFKKIEGLRGAPGGLRVSVARVSGVLEHPTSFCNVVEGKFHDAKNSSPSGFEAYREMVQTLSASSKVTCL